MAEVLALARRVEPHARGEDDRLAAVVGRGRDACLARLAVLQPLDRERLASGEAERLRARPSGYWSGTMPIPIRFERWMRS